MQKISLFKIDEFDRFLIDYRDRLIGKRQALILQCRACMETNEFLELHIMVKLL